ncbi:hypothetical protein [Flavobacterium sp.]|uniref:hypothetical protein n=1 Tax=Flavobacterium sp. TaxID=239 RepID=UPI001229CE71|nr:hypothetical protein [Flavobacterium sp.]RZJ70241.1 MAG: hypothetical protein EOO49_14755 [Flavobacterium sp.]
MVLVDVAKTGEKENTLLRSLFFYCFGDFGFKVFTILAKRLGKAICLNALNELNGSKISDEEFPFSDKQFVLMPLMNLMVQKFPMKNSQSVISKARNALNELNGLKISDEEFPVSDKKGILMNLTVQKFPMKNSHSAISNSS